jgi:tetratricopeptide (TPR) repeat protein
MSGRYLPGALIGLVAALSLLAAAAPGHAQGVDRVRRQNGLDTGKITKITPLEVTISKSGVESTIAAENVQSVYLAGEPIELNAARNALQAGRPADALKSLEAIEPDAGRREEVSAEIDFHTALAKTQLALAGQGDLDEALRDMRAFISGRASSFHIPEALERAGDLLTAAAQFAPARTEYAKLALAKSNYYKLRSALLVGRAWQAEGDHAKAKAEFDKVLAAAGDDGLVDALKLSATLDRAVSEAAAGNAEQAATSIAAIIAKTDPEDGQLLARAYNALGDSYLKSGDKRGALFAFLHVDLLYQNVADAHAKALHELIPLWRDAGQATRSQEAAQKLAEKYPGSRWAKVEGQ